MNRLEGVMATLEFFDDIKEETSHRRRYSSQYVVAIRRTSVYRYNIKTRRTGERK